jgi:hypothetical protein
MIACWSNRFENLSIKKIQCGAGCCTKNTCQVKTSFPLIVKEDPNSGRGCTGPNIYSNGGNAQCGKWKSNQILVGCVVR